MNYCFLLDVKIPIGSGDIRVYSMSVTFGWPWPSDHIWQQFANVSNKKKFRKYFYPIFHDKVKIHLLSLIFVNDLAGIKSGRVLVSWKYVMLGFQSN